MGHVRSAKAAVTGILRHTCACVWRVCLKPLNEAPIFGPFSVQVYIGTFSLNERGRISSFISLPLRSDTRRRTGAGGSGTHSENVQQRIHALVAAALDKRLDSQSRTAFDVGAEAAVRQCAKYRIERLPFVHPRVILDEEIVHVLQSIGNIRNDDGFRTLDIELQKMHSLIEVVAKPHDLDRHFVPLLIPGNNVSGRGLPVWNPNSVSLSQTPYCSGVTS